MGLGLQIWNLAAFFFFFSFGFLVYLASSPRSLSDNNQTEWLYHSTCLIPLDLTLLWNASTILLLVTQKKQIYSGDLNVTVTWFENAKQRHLE